MAVGESHLRDQIYYHGTFSSVVFHKFETGRRIVEQVGDYKSSSVGTAGTVIRDDLAAVDYQSCACLFIFRLGQQLRPGDGAYGGKGLSPESEGFYRVQVGGLPDLAGSMAQKGLFCILHTV